MTPFPFVSMKRIITDCKEHVGGVLIFGHYKVGQETEYCFTCNSIFAADSIPKAPESIADKLQRRLDHAEKVRLRYQNGGRGCIYVITNTVNGMQYVGQSNNVKKRWSQHKYDAMKGSNQILHKAMREFGIDRFIISVIGRTNTGLFWAEQKCIAHLNSTYPNGYNMPFVNVIDRVKARKIKAERVALSD